MVLPSYQQRVGAVILGADVAGNYPIPIAPSGGASDAFGRLRISQPQTIFDSKQLFDNQPLFWDDAEVSGGGTSSSYSSARASTIIGVSASTAGRRLRQTFRRFNYQPGKSQLILLTGVIGSGGSGITSRIGYGDDDNGLFFEVVNGTAYVNSRSSVSGSPVDDYIAQSQWNLDPLDGRGPSGYTLDLDKANIFFIDFEWLGVGLVRMGFVIDGQWVYAHQFKNANNLSSVYMSTPNLPLRYEIENDGSGEAATLEHICSSVASEGGTERLGVQRWLSTAGTHLNADAADTVYAAIGLRLKSSHLGATVLLEQVSAIAETADDFEWLVVFNPTVAGTFTYSDVANSALQTAVGVTANTVTGGTYVAGGWGASGQAETLELSNSLLLGSAIDGTPDEVVLCIRPLSINLDIQAGVLVRELL